MRFKFLHFSDAHLGFQQYGSDERFNDFGRAFEHVVDEVLRQKVDFVIFAGDLFQKRSIDPPTLIQAVNNLDRLRQAGVPMVAVEGNHERAHYQDKFSWTDFLAERKLLVLLNPDMGPNGADLARWDGLSGAFVDLQPGHSPILTETPQGKTVRVYGIKYFGAATQQALEGVADALSRVDHSQVEYAILILHAGLEGEMDNISATVPHAAIAPFTSYVDYLALGHFHKPYQRDGWIFNPGSIETCSVQETAWPERGFFLVEVDTQTDPRQQARLLPCPRRPFIRLNLDVDACQTPENLCELVEQQVGRETARRPLASPPVLEVTLTGTLHFSVSGLNLNHVRAAAERAAGEVLLVRLNNRTVPVGFEIQADEALPRVEVEHQVIRELLERDARFSPQACAWARLAMDVKRMALDGTAPEDIAALIAARSGEIELAPPPESPIQVHEEGSPTTEPVVC